MDRGGGVLCVCAGLDKLAGVALRDLDDGRHFLWAEEDAEVCVCALDEFWAECGGDELGVAGEGVYLVGDGGAVLGVEVCVDLVEEVEGGWVALLDGEDEREGDERGWPATQLRGAQMRLIGVGCHVRAGRTWRRVRRACVRRGRR